MNPIYRFFMPGKSTNLLNPETVIKSGYIYTSDYIEVVEGDTYLFKDRANEDVALHVWLYTADKTVISEYFVLCTGNSSTQIKALAGEVEYRLQQRGITPYGVEGRDNNSWLIVDYSNVIVHIFSRESREFYNLDKLYAD